MCRAHPRSRRAARRGSEVLRRARTKTPRSRRDPDGHAGLGALTRERRQRGASPFRIEPPACHLRICSRGAGDLFPSTAHAWRRQAGRHPSALARIGRGSDRHRNDHGPRHRRGQRRDILRCTVRVVADRRRDGGGSHSLGVHHRGDLWRAPQPRRHDRPRRVPLVSAGAHRGIHRCPVRRCQYWSSAQLLVLRACHLCLRGCARTRARHARGPRLGSGLPVLPPWPRAHSDSNRPLFPGVRLRFSAKPVPQGLITNVVGASALEGLAMAVLTFVILVVTDARSAAPPAAAPALIGLTVQPHRAVTAPPPILKYLSRNAHPHPRTHSSRRSSPCLVRSPPRESTRHETSGRASSRR